MTLPPPDAALRLAAIVESTDDAIVSKDLAGVITSWNRGAEHLFGYSSADVVGQSITLLIPADRRQDEDLVLERIRAGERVEAFDTVRRRKDGTLVDVSITVSPIRDTSGVIIGASKIARSIADRERIEMALREVQDRLMALAAASASIFASPNVDAVLAASIDLARDVVASDGYALWRGDAAGAWRVAASFGISDEFAARVLTGDGSHGDPGDVPFAEPFICTDVATAPMLAPQREAYAREGIVSMTRVHGGRPHPRSRACRGGLAGGAERPLVCARQSGEPPQGRVPGHTLP